MDTNFTCEICEQTFTTNSKKNQHISNVHGEVKIFQCNICTKSLKTKHNLLSHVKNNHQAKNHHCKCGKVFAKGTVFWKGHGGHIFKLFPANIWIPKFCLFTVFAIKLLLGKTYGLMNLLRIKYEHLRSLFQA